MDAIALVGLVVLMAGFGIAVTHVAQFRSRDGNRRDHGDAGGCDGGGSGDAT